MLFICAGNEVLVNQAADSPPGFFFSTHTHTHTHRPYFRQRFEYLHIFHKLYELHFATRWSVSSTFLFWFFHIIRRSPCPCCLQFIRSTFRSSITFVLFYLQSVLSHVYLLIVLFCLFSVFVYIWPGCSISSCLLIFRLVIPIEFNNAALVKLVLESNVFFILVLSYFSWPSVFFRLILSPPPLFHYIHSLFLVNIFLLLSSLALRRFRAIHGAYIVLKRLSDRVGADKAGTL